MQVQRNELFMHIERGGLAYSQSPSPRAVCQSTQLQVCHVLPFANPRKRYIPFYSVLEKLQVSFCDMPATVA